MGSTLAAPLNVLSMHGGSGEHGYQNNSLLQNFNFHTYAKGHLSQALHQLFKRFSPHHFHDPQSVYKHPQCTSSDDPFADEITVTAQNDSAGLLSHGSLDLCAGSQRGPEHDLEPLSAPPAKLHVDDTCTLTCSPCDQNTDVSRRHHDRYIAAHLVMADFGCSHGPNALDHAEFIVQELQQYLKSSMSLHGANKHIEAAPKPTIEVQYYFSDLPNNNFNSLVQSLDSFWNRQVLQADDDGQGAPFIMEIFDGVVSGSFHKRLFPTKSVHLAISVYGLHWLSQVPREVVDKASPAWNGGHIWLHGQRPAVVQAYARQFKEDLRSFLLSRAQEMAGGGILFLFFPGRAEKSPEGSYFTPNYDIWTGCYEDTWKEMVTEGLISEEEMDMFNIPFFNCHLSEMQEVLDGFSAEFKVLKMEVLKDCQNVPKNVGNSLREDPKAFGEFCSRFVASLMEPMVEACLGPSRVRMLFDRLKHQATLKAHLLTFMAYDMVLAIIQRI